MLVIGKKVGKFKDKDTGKDVDFAKLYLSGDFDESVIKHCQCEGQEAMAVSVSVELASTVTVGEVVEPVYNKYGRIISFE